MPDPDSSDSDADSEPDINCGCNKCVKKLGTAGGRSLFSDYPGKTDDEEDDDDDKRDPPPSAALQCGDHNAAAPPPSPGGGKASRKSSDTSTRDWTSSSTDPLARSVPPESFVEPPTADFPTTDVQKSVSDVRSGIPTSARERKKVEAPIPLPAPQTAPDSCHTAEVHRVEFHATCGICGTDINLQNVLSYSYTCYIGRGAPCVLSHVHSACLLGPKFLNIKKKNELSAPHPCATNGCDGKVGIIYSHKAGVLGEEGRELYWKDKTYEKKKAEEEAAVLAKKQKRGAASEHRSDDKENKSVGKIRGEDESSTMSGDVHDDRIREFEEASKNYVSRDELERIEAEERAAREEKEKLEAEAAVVAAAAAAAEAAARTRKVLPVHLDAKPLEKKEDKVASKYALPETAAKKDDKKKKNKKARKETKVWMPNMTVEGQRGPTHDDGWGQEEEEPEGEREAEGGAGTQSSGSGTGDFSQMAYPANNGYFAENFSGATPRPDFGFARPMEIGNMVGYGRPPTALFAMPPDAPSMHPSFFAREPPLQAFPPFQPPPPIDTTPPPVQPTELPAVSQDAPDPLEHAPTDLRTISDRLKRGAPLISVEAPVVVEEEMWPALPRDERDELIERIKSILKKEEIYDMAQQTSVEISGFIVWLRDLVLPRMAWTPKEKEKIIRIVEEMSDDDEEMIAFFDDLAPNYKRGMVDGKLHWRGTTTAERATEASRNRSSSVDENDEEDADIKRAIEASRHTVVADEAKRFQIIQDQKRAEEERKAANLEQARAAKAAMEEEKARRERANAEKKRMAEEMKRKEEEEKRKAEEAKREEEERKRRADEKKKKENDHLAMLVKAEKERREREAAARKIAEEEAEQKKLEMERAEEERARLEAEQREMDELAARTRELEEAREQMERIRIAEMELQERLRNEADRAPGSVFDVAFKDAEAAHGEVSSSASSSTLLHPRLPRSSHPPPGLSRTDSAGSSLTGAPIVLPQPIANDPAKAPQHQSSGMTTYPRASLATMDPIMRRLFVPTIPAPAPLLHSSIYPSPVGVHWNPIQQPGSNAAPRSRAESTSSLPPSVKETKAPPPPSTPPTKNAEVEGEESGRKTPEDWMDIASPEKAANLPPIPTMTLGSEDDEEQADGAARPPYIPTPIGRRPDGSVASSRPETPIGGGGASANPSHFDVRGPVVDLGGGSADSNLLSIEGLQRALAEEKENSRRIMEELRARDYDKQRIADLESVNLSVQDQLRRRDMLYRNSKKEADGMESALREMELESERQREEYTETLEKERYEHKQNLDHLHEIARTAKGLQHAAGMRAGEQKARAELTANRLCAMIRAATEIISRLNFLTNVCRSCARGGAFTFLVTAYTRHWEGYIRSARDLQSKHQNGEDVIAATFALQCPKLKGHDSLFALVDTWRKERPRLVHDRVIGCFYETRRILNAYRMTIDDPVIHLTLYKYFNDVGPDSRAASPRKLANLVLKANGMGSLPLEAKAVSTMTSAHLAPIGAERGVKKSKSGSSVGGGSGPSSSFNGGNPWSIKQSEPTGQNRELNIGKHECLICLEVVSHDGAKSCDLCSEPYHIECIDSWLSRNNSTCPQCRGKIVSDTFFPRLTKT